MPLIFAVIYIRISAGVNIYFVVSSLCRIGIQEAIFRSGVLDKAPTRGEGRLPARGGGGGTPRRSIMERLADAQQRALEQQKARQAGLQPELDMPREQKDGPKPASKAPPATKPPADKPRAAPSGDAAPPKDTASSNGGRSSNGAAKPNGAGKPGGAAKRPNGASTNGGAQRGSARAGSNGAPAPKEQPPGHPRAAKKRPRKAR
jgi:hypothetical protein